MLKNDAPWVEKAAEDLRGRARVLLQAEMDGRGPVGELQEAVWVQVELQVGLEVCVVAPMTNVLAADRSATHLTARQAATCI